MRKYIALVLYKIFQYRLKRQYKKDNHLAENICGIHYTKLGFSDINLFNKFFDLICILDMIPNINNGGCGISVYIISDFLDKHNIKYKFGVITNEVEHFVYNTLPYRHIFIVIDNKYYFDTRGVIRTDDVFEDGYYISFLDKNYKVEYLVKQIENKNIWNTKFKRPYIYPICLDYSPNLIQNVFI